MMEAKNHLIGEKTKLLIQIAEAAQRGESREVLATTEKLGKVESLIRRCEELEREVFDLDRESPLSGPLEKTRSGHRSLKNKPQTRPSAQSSRQIGETIRAAFLKEVAGNGVHLQQIKGTIYRTQAGQRIGIAVATERQPDRWFLGLPMGGFDHAILLCQRDSGDTVEIYLPKRFFDTYGDSMSTAKNQMKFNIARRGGGYVIVVPGTGGVSVSEFPKDRSILR